MAAVAISMVLVTGGMAWNAAENSAMTREMKQSQEMKLISSILVMFMVLAKEANGKKMSRR